MEGLPGWPEEDLTPLHVASCKGEIAMVKLLVKYGAELKNIRKIWDPIHFAIMEDLPAVVRYFIYLISCKNLFYLIVVLC